MGKKRKQKASRSDKRMQRLYEEAIKEVKGRNINIDDLPAAENEDSNDDTSVKEKLVPQKPRKKPKEVLEESLKKQEELRKPRTSLSVPVSRLLPFTPNERRLEFPRDFRRNSTSHFWIPRSETPLPEYAYSGRRSPSSDFEDLEKEIFSWRESPEDNTVGDILQVFPLRVQEDDNIGVSETTTRLQQLPPIYRQELWRETMCRSSEPSRSIPAKQDAWSISDPTSLMVGKQELYTREKRKSSVSLAERRFRLRVACRTSGRRNYCP